MKNWGLLIASVAIVCGIWYFGFRSLDRRGPGDGFEVVETEAGTVIVETPAQRIEKNKQTSRAMVESASQYDEAQWLHHWELTERSGRKVTSTELLGRPYLVSYFYSSCPSICVQQNDQLSLLQAKFKDLPIQLVSITCDPEFDTPEQLQAYSKRFQADEERWWFCTGDWTYLKRITAEVFFHALRRPKEHIEKFILMDAEGHLFADYDWHSEEELKILAEDIRKLSGR